MKKTIIPVLLIIVSVAWCQIEYQQITGELLEHWNTAYSSNFLQIHLYDSSNLPDNIYELLITGIEVERDSLDIYLMGMAPKTDIPFLLATGGYRGEYNFAKSFSKYYKDDDEILLSFQMPGSARYCQARYRWNVEEESLVLLRYYSADPSLDAMERIDSLLTEGDIAEAIDELNNMFYPGSYYSSDEMIARLLRSINRTAHEEADENNYQRAVDTFRTLRDYLIMSAEWYTAFDDSLDYVECNYANYMGLSEYVMIMNNYAYFLEQINDLNESLIVLRKVMDLEPSRMVAHLNIADVLWGFDEFAEAKDHYETYLEMMTDRELTHQIPLRVNERISTLPSDLVSLSWVVEIPEMAIGQWIEYGANNLSETLTISVVSSETNQGTECYWIQISVTDFVGQILVDPESMKTAMESYEQQLGAFVADPEAYIRNNMHDTSSTSNLFFNEESMYIVFKFISAVRMIKFEQQGQLMAIDFAGVPEFLEEIMSDSLFKKQLQQTLTQSFNAEGGQEGLDTIIAELENMQFSMIETDVDVAGTSISSVEFSIVHPEVKVEVVLSSELPLIPFAYGGFAGPGGTSFIEVRGYGFSGTENLLPGEPAQIIQGMMILQGMR